MAGGTSLAKRRKALKLAGAALEGLAEQLWQAQGAELGPLMTLIDALGERVEGAKVAVLSEAVQRGEVGGRTHEWLREWAPSFRSGGSARMVRVVEATRQQRYSGLRQAVVEGRVPVVNAACVVEEYERIGHRLHPDAQEPVMDCLVGLAETGCSRDIRRVRQQLIAKYGCAGEFQTIQDKAREQRSLSQPCGDGTGRFDYHLVVDEEAKAVIEAAVGALSAPRPVDGERDLRNSGQRRMDALLEVVRRGVASADGVATTTKTQLLVSMELTDLLARTNAGTVLGSTAAGTLLGPETVRKLACDAGVVPVMLGAEGEVLELGRKVRFFTEGQVRAMWLRDGGCSFPGCTVPASWCDGHHLWHWADGGPTDLDHGALLCGRHHDVVHRKGYHGRVLDGRVQWDLTPGAYDHWLRQRQSGAGDAKSAPSTGSVGASPTSADSNDSPGEPAETPMDVWGHPGTRASALEFPPWRP